MSKIKKKFICQECGYESARWMGKCPECEKWNTFVEEFYTSKSSINEIKTSTSNIAITLEDVIIEEEKRFSTGMRELDRVLGGGVVPGSLILIGGDPGIGKSTILLQISNQMARENLKVLYVSGEESVKQIKLRADRLKVYEQGLYILSETNMFVIEKVIEQIKPNVLMIDSVQTMYHSDLSSAPGSVGQVREITARLMPIAKEKGIATFLVGHVTKQGAIAGPRVLEHMVDTVLYFEGERHQTYRILRAVKNRFGSTNEIGMFEMRDRGLEEVKNPSEMLLSGRPIDSPGTIAIPCIEGTRPILIELQALVSYTNFGMPRRMATGIDYNRVILLIAIIEKRLGMQLQNQDAYVNIIGGLKVDEPSVDLGVILAIASSFKNIPIDPGMAALGEVGLTGEVRSVQFIEKRIMEAQKMGFKKCIIPKSNLKGLKKTEEIEVIGVSTVYEALRYTF
ncbi:DNA repair protein RadA [Garciella nitratireducens]|uniref:DNA repair protein RadA n=1 Tax=Garciella nitratireducens TaxID=218205 RepID=UPI000DEBDCF9|nr:DNA repair protein RadA [Garciella nitratireducens]RBP44846.1 DNA repair protein RadA/Sms [Garciella nitratireducens]